MSTYNCFKFKPINKFLIDSLVNSHFYFGSRTQLNDPFDCHIDLVSIIRRASKENHELDQLLQEKDFFSNFQRQIDLLDIGSFSLELHETLMWSHYADDHKGLCIRYDFPYEFLNDQDNIMGVSKVNYEPNTVSEWLINNANLYKTDHFSFVSELLKVVLTAKSPAWDYEQEARIIRPVAGVFDIPREFVKSIIFGLQTSKQDEELIKSIVSKFYSECGVWACR